MDLQCVVERQEAIINTLVDQLRQQQDLAQQWMQIAVWHYETSKKQPKPPMDLETARDRTWP